MSASDDRLRGRGDAIDEVLHLLSEYAMVGGSDRELRRDLEQMRDDAPYILAGRLFKKAKKATSEER